MIEVGLDLEKAMPRIDLGEPVSLVIVWADEGPDRVAHGDGVIVAVDRDDDRPTAIEVKVNGSGAIYRVPIPAEVAALPPGAKHYKQVAVETSIVPHPSDGRPAVLLQLTDGFIIMRPQGALDVSTNLHDIAQEAARQGG